MARIGFVMNRLALKSEASAKAFELYDWYKDAMKNGRLTAVEETLVLARLKDKDIMSVHFDSSERLVLRAFVEGDSLKWNRTYLQLISDFEDEAAKRSWEEL